MAYLESVQILIFLGMANSNTRVGAIISAFCAEVFGARAFDSITWSVVVTVYPALQMPCWTKLLPSVYQESSASSRGSSFRCGWADCFNSFQAIV